MCNFGCNFPQFLRIAFLKFQWLYTRSESYRMYKIHYVNDSVCGFWRLFMFLNCKTNNSSQLRNDWHFCVFFSRLSRFLLYSLQNFNSNIRFSIEDKTVQKNLFRFKIYYARDGEMNRITILKNTRHCKIYTARNDRNLNYKNQSQFPPVPTAYEGKMRHIIFNLIYR